MNAIAHLRFSKMHGAGNDFVILDRRDATQALDPALAARLADRHRGVGCDQVITIEPSGLPDCIARYGIWNADGSAAAQCGNGARCVAAWLQRDGAANGTRFGLESPAGRVEAELLSDGRVAIEMGIPDFSAAAIGLRDPVGSDPFVLDFPHGRVYLGVVSIGNPHAVLEVNEIADADVARTGAMLQQDPLFTRSCNVGFAQVMAPDRLRLRVYERGVGETLACGSGACAAVAVLARRGRLGPQVAVELAGGTLQIRWAGPGQPLWMSGPATFVFEGEFAG
jgi:diaminopimelate epimerase